MAWSAGSCGPSRWSGLLALAALDLSWFARSLNPTIPHPSYKAEVSRLQGTVEGAARVSHADEVKIVKTYVDYKDSGAGGDPAHVVSSGISNTLMLVGVRDAGGYEPVRRKDYSDLSGKVASGVTDQLSWSPESGPTRRPVVGPRPSDLQREFASDRVGVRRSGRDCASRGALGRSGSSYATYLLLAGVRESTVRTRRSNDSEKVFREVRGSSGSPQGRFLLRADACPRWGVSDDARRRGVGVSLCGGR